jgi:hypothetical protein
VGARSQVGAGGSFLKDTARCLSGFWPRPWSWQLFLRDWCIRSVPRGSVGQFVVIISQPQHRCGCRRISHPVGHRTHFRGTVAPVPGIVDVGCGHGEALQEKSGFGWDFIPAPSGGRAKCPRQARSERRLHGRAGQASLAWPPDAMASASFRSA